jgi:hypothetical protein
VAQRQINIRLSDEDVAVLEAAAFLESQALADVVRGTLLERVATLRREPEVATLLDLRARRAAERSGAVTSLDARRKRQRPDGGDPA